MIGVGGLFLQFKCDKQEVQDWDEQNLGLLASQYGSGFTQGEQLMLVSFSYGDQEAPLVNLRVDDLDELVATISGQGAAVRDLSDHAIGRFVRSADPFGNLIGLWEPRAEGYRRWSGLRLRHNGSKTIL